MVIGILIQIAAKAGVVLKKAQHRRAVLQKCIHNVRTKTFPGFTLQIGTRGLLAILNTLLARQMVVGDPQHAAGKSGGAAKHRLFFDNLDI